MAVRRSVSSANVAFALITPPELVSIAASTTALGAVVSQFNELGRWSVSADADTENPNGSYGGTHAVLPPLTSTITFRIRCVLRHARFPL